MSLSIGIVGLPNVGKSTLFQTLTKKQVPAENYPFCTIEPNVGTVAVPDLRLNALTEISGSAKTIPTIIEFIDIAGLVRGASQGEGLGNKFLDNIRQVDAICHVVRSFHNDDITHVENRINPIEDIEIINTELLLSDLEQLNRILPNIEKKAKTKDGDSMKILPILQQIHQSLSEGKSIHTLELDAETQHSIKSYNFLTAKPVMYLINTDENYHIPEDLEVFLSKSTSIPISIRIESELALMEPTEQQEYLAMLGQELSGLDRLIQTGYKLLNLQSFFTTGPTESRAWTIPIGTKAQQGAGTIHSDIERGFIMAEVISYQDFIDHNGEQGAKQAGKLRQEGKEYILQDGDICHFRFNV